MTLYVAIILMGVLGLVLGCIIGVFVKFFKVETDSRVDLVLELLPGANCGGCGKAGCADLARAIVAGEEPPGKCPVASAEQVSAIALALGISAGEGVRKQAVVFCRADIGNAAAMNYNGVQDCASAALVAGGPNNCRYGCLGMGSCARKCPFGAIEMFNGVAVVHRELCVGCGNCVAACPRGVIRLVPAEADVHVYCSSPDKGAVKRSICKAACIGCRKCVKAAPEKFTVNGFLAQVNYEAETLPTAEDIPAVGCPAGVIVTAAERYAAAKAAESAKGGKK